MSGFRMKRAGLGGDSEARRAALDFPFYVRSLLPNSWRPNGEWLAGNCPMCHMNGEPTPDTKRRGGFNFSQGISYWCFRCQFKAGWRPGPIIGRNLQSLLVELGASPRMLGMIRREFYRLRQSGEIDFEAMQTEAKVEREPFTADWDEKDLPEGCVPLHESDSRNADRAREMLAERKLDFWHDWFIDSTDSRFRNRLILPYRRNRKIVGCMGRSLNPNAKLKIYADRPKHFLFNLDLQATIDEDGPMTVPSPCGTEGEFIMNMESARRWDPNAGTEGAYVEVERPFVLLTEGEFDALTLHGVAFCGGGMSDEKQDMIRALGRKVILVPDFDETLEKRVGVAIRNGWSVSFPEWATEYKDANEASMHLGRAFVVHSVIESAVSSGKMGMRARVTQMQSVISRRNPR